MFGYECLFIGMVGELPFRGEGRKQVSQDCGGERERSCHGQEVVLGRILSCLPDHRYNSGRWHSHLAQTVAEEDGQLLRSNFCTEWKFSHLFTNLL